VFIRIDKSSCDHCLKMDDEEVLPNADEEVGDKRIVYKSNKN
jgi:hypothetical protein